jgi:hypothetical protein
LSVKRTADENVDDVLNGPSRPCLISIDSPQGRRRLKVSSGPDSGSDGPASAGRFTAPPGRPVSSFPMPTTFPDTHNLIRRHVFVFALSMMGSGRGRFAKAFSQWCRQRSPVRRRRFHERTPEHSRASHSICENGRKNGHTWPTLTTSWEKQKRV